MVLTKQTCRFKNFVLSRCYIECIYIDFVKYMFVSVVEYTK